MTRGLHWFRADLRLRDNVALIDLCSRVDEWLPVFIVDPKLVRAALPRVRFLFDCVERLAADLEARGVPLIVRRGRPEVVLPKLVRESAAELVSWNEGTTPFAHARDTRVHERIEHAGARVLRADDATVFRADEIRSGSGGPYAVYTPYRNAWWKLWRDEPRFAQRAPRLPRPIAGLEAGALPALKPVAATAPVLPTGGEAAAQRRLKAFVASGLARYAEDRDRPEFDGTSRLSPYLRFGAVSARDCFSRALEAASAEPRLAAGAKKWLDELVWRDFYAMITVEHPRVLRSNHRREYDALEWRDDPKRFRAWCEGRTGFPIVDAGMRQLNATGWMHNRVRMIVASFLTKDLLIDWREGERYFFDALVDGDPASNAGGWQWAASTGTDAQPYFRIFNPTAQGKRWDPAGNYVRQWVPELRALDADQVHEPWQGGAGPEDYPRPIVDHGERRELALAAYRRARTIGAVGKGKTSK